MSMNTDGLLPILAYSKKRKEILFLLQEKARTLSDIKDHFDVKAPEIMPRLKEMEAANMICKKGDLFYITPLGNVTAVHYRPFLDTIAAIEANEDFWNEHDISAIPYEFLIRIKELKECRVVTNDCTLGTHETFIRNVKNSNNVCGITPVFDRTWPPLFLNLARMGTSVSLLVTEKVFDIIKKEHSSELEDGLLFENASMFVGGSPKLAFIVTDGFFSMSLVSNGGKYDSQCDLVSTDNAAIKWGTDLFKYYKENSIEIKGIGAPNEWIEPHGQSVGDIRECP